MGIKCSTNFLSGNLLLETGTFSLHLLLFVAKCLLNTLLMLISPPYNYTRCEKCVRLCVRGGSLAVTS